MTNRGRSGALRICGVLQDEDFSDRDHERIEADRIVGAALLRDYGIDYGIKPYAGKLGDHLDELLADLEEPERSCVEETLRHIIATEAGGNPKRLSVALINDVLDVQILSPRIS